MNQRLSTVAGFLATASLLGGSAFAFAPEFDHDFPTVIITDKRQDLPASTPFDDGTMIGSETTEFNFRFSKAFDLVDRVVDLRGNDFNEIRYLFNEFDSFTDTTPNQDHTLLINGNRAFADGTDTFPASSDVADGFLAIDRYPDGGLDFRNRDFSGDDESINSGHSGIGAVTGQDISLSPSQERVVQLYLKGDTSDDVVIRSFLVITTTDGNDRLDDPAFTDPWTTIADIQEFGGWNGAALGILASIPFPSGNDFVILGTGATGGYTFSPGAGAAPPGTGSLGITGAASQIGFAQYQLDIADSGISVAANNLYRLRANIYSPNPNANDDVRLFFGDEFQTGLSIVAYNSDEQVPSGAATLSNDPSNVWDAYLLAEGSGPIRIGADIVNLGTGSGQAYTLNSIQVRELPSPLVNLGTGTTIFNYGGPVATPIAEEGSDIVASPDGFTAGSTVGVGWEWGALNTNQPVTFNPSANQLGITYGAVAGNAPPSFGQLALAGGSAVDPTVPGAFEVANDKLYMLDVWASTSTPKTAEKTFPTLRVGVGQQANYFAYNTYIMSPVAGTGTGATPLQTAIQTAPRAYTLVWHPQVSDSVAQATLAIVLLSTDNVYPTASTINIHRVTLREFALPPN